MQFMQHVLPTPTELHFLVFYKCPNAQLQWALYAHNCVNCTCCTHHGMTC